LKLEAKKDTPIKDATKIFVGGIPVKVTVAEFRKYFGEFGQIKNCILSVNAKCQSQNLGYGFIVYQDPQTVANILKCKKNLMLRAKIVL